MRAWAGGSGSSLAVRLEVDHVGGQNSVREGVSHGNRHDFGVFENGWEELVRRAGRLAQGAETPQERSASRLRTEPRGRPAIGADLVVRLAVHLELDALLGVRLRRRQL